MSNKYFDGNKGRYIFCDICGQAVYTIDAKRLSSYTGRPGLLVCPNDADVVDKGLKPFVPTTEHSPKWTRTQRDVLTNGATPENPETSTALGS